MALEQTGPVREAKAVLDEAKAKRDRAARLINQGIIPRAEYDTADAERDLRRQIGFVLQENYLFDDTIARNIAFGEEDPDMERIAWAAKVANAHEFIQRLPLGFETRVGETGIALSGSRRSTWSVMRSWSSR